MLFIAVFTPGAALLCCHIQKSWCRPGFKRALPGCSLMEESQWMGHTDAPWGTLSLVSIYLPSHVLCQGHLTSDKGWRPGDGKETGMEISFGGQGINKACWHFIPAEEHVNRVPTLALTKYPDLCETEPGGWCKALAQPSITPKQLSYPEGGEQGLTQKYGFLNCF